MTYTINKVSNGWILQWEEAGCEVNRVFTDADVLLTDLGHRVGALRENEFYEVWHHGEQSNAHAAEPGSVDELVDSLLAPGQQAGD